MPISFLLSSFRCTPSSQFHRKCLFFVFRFFYYSIFTFAKCWIRFEHCEMNSPRERHWQSHFKTILLFRNSTEKKHTNKLNLNLFVVDSQHRLKLTFWKRLKIFKNRTLHLMQCESLLKNVCGWIGAYVHILPLVTYIRSMYLFVFMFRFIVLLALLKISTKSRHAIGVGTHTYASKVPSLNAIKPIDFPFRQLNRII